MSLFSLALACGHFALSAVEDLLNSRNFESEQPRRAAQLQVLAAVRKFSVLCRRACEHKLMHCMQQQL